MPPLLRTMVASGDAPPDDEDAMIAAYVATNFRPVENYATGENYIAMKRPRRPPAVGRSGVHRARPRGAGRPPRRRTGSRTSRTRGGDSGDPEPACRPAARCDGGGHDQVRDGVG